MIIWCQSARHLLLLMLLLLRKASKSRRLCTGRTTLRIYRMVEREFPTRRMGGLGMDGC